MNRNNLLKEVIPSWISLGIPIFIRDWSSEIPASSEPWTKHPLITVLRAENEKWFHPCKAKNLSLRTAKAACADYVFHLDCDVRITKPELYFTMVRGDVFYGGWGGGLQGTWFGPPVCLHDENLEIVQYGMECGTLYRDFKNAGLKKMFMPANFIEHLSHSQASRLEYYPPEVKSRLQTGYEKHGD